MDGETLRFDGGDALGRHVGFERGVFAPEFGGLRLFERSPRVALDAADAPAAAQVAGETFAQQVGADDFAVDLDHLRGV